MIAVWGPTGAPGRSTVALNLAAELAGRSATLLVDADTYGASLAQALGLLDEAPGLAAAARAAEQGTLDLVALARLAPAVSDGLRVLTGIPRAERWTELRAASMTHVLDLARDLAAFVVVDCGFAIEDDEELSYDTLAPRRNAATLTTLEAADDLVVVGSADPVGLQRLVRAVQDLRTLTVPAAQSGRQPGPVDVGRVASATTDQRGAREVRRPGGPHLPAVRPGDRRRRPLRRSAAVRVRPAVRAPPGARRPSRPAMPASSRQRRGAARRARRARPRALRS